MTLSPCFNEKQEGIGLLELMLSLAVIAMLLIMATRYYATAHMGEQVNTGAGIVQALTGAAAQYEAGQGNYSGISLGELFDFGLVPQDICNSSTACNGTLTSNPWGGGITVTPTNSNAQIVISLTDIPLQACTNLNAKLGNQGTVGTCAGASSTFTFTPNT